MEQRKYILDRFQDHLEVAYEAYCTRHGIQDTKEQFITFLIDQDLINPTYLQRYTVVKEFEKLRSEHDCPKTQAVDTLANRFRLSERTVWNMLKSLNDRKGKGSDENILLIHSKKSQSIQKTMQEITVLILTPLALEFNAVIKHLKNEQPAFVHEGAAYTIGEFVGKDQRYKIVLREPGMLPVEMALATEKAIQKFRPQIAILLGVAGGIKDVTFGDVLIATKVYGYEGGKEDKDGFKARPVAGSCSRELLAYAQIVSRSDNWKKRTHDGASKARIWLGAIAAGNKVIASIDNPTFQRIKTHYNDTLGVEMEADGFVAALQSHPSIHGLVIRGISDMCEGKKEDADIQWQPLAAERASVVAMEILAILDSKAIKILGAEGMTKSNSLVQNAKNVIIGSNIQVGGDFRLGDG